MLPLVPSVDVLYAACSARGTGRLHVSHYLLPYAPGELVELEMWLWYASHTAHVFLNMCIRHSTHSTCTTHGTRVTVQMPLNSGELVELEVWHDNGGLGAAWHLDYIEVHCSTNNKVGGCRRGE